MIIKFAGYPDTKNERSKVLMISKIDERNGVEWITRPN